MNIQASFTAVLLVQADSSDTWHCSYLRLHTRQHAHAMRFTKQLQQHVRSAMTSTMSKVHRVYIVGITCAVSLCISLMYAEMLYLLLLLLCHRVKG
jgi:hypothetical protein